MLRSQLPRRWIAAKDERAGHFCAAVFPAIQICKVSLVTYRLYVVLSLLIIPMSNENALNHMHTLRGSMAPFRRTMHIRMTYNHIQRSLLFACLLALVWCMRGVWRYHKDGAAFTLMTMSYLPRAALLEGFLDHYKTCSGVGDILVVWNGEGVENVRHLESKNVRIRVEENPSMNNRYKPDDLIRHRGVLSLDDDLRIPCASLDAAFRVWQKNPETLVGWFPRLVRRSSRGVMEYLGEPETIQEQRYNMILTGAAFIDSSVYFKIYWSPELHHLRDIVDEKKNCDDILMNFVVASRCGEISEASCQTVRYLRPQELIDLSHVSGVGISHDEEAFITAANECIVSYSNTFGMPLKSETFHWTANHALPYCDVQISKLFCVYREHGTIHVHK